MDEQDISVKMRVTAKKNNDREIQSFLHNIMWHQVTHPNHIRYKVHLLKEIYKQFALKYNCRIHNGLNPLGKEV